MATRRAVDNPWATEEERDSSRRQQTIDALAPDTQETLLPGESSAPGPGATTPAAPATTPPPAASPATLPPVTAPPSADPFASMGGGVQTPGGGWLPAGHPLAGTGGGGGAATQGMVNDATRNMITKLLAPGYETPSLDDPALAASAAAHQRALDRSTQRNRSQMAARYAAGGMGDSGALNAAIERGLQGAGEDQAGFEGQLMVQELAARRAQVQQALALGSGLLTAEQQRDLQLQLAAIDDATRRYGIGVQDQQFRDTLGFNIADRNQYWSWYPYSLGLGG